jgi:hypothetical protein
MSEAGFEIIGDGLRNQWNPMKMQKRQLLSLGNRLRKNNQMSKKDISFDKVILSKKPE